MRILAQNPMAAAGRPHPAEITSVPMAGLKVPSANQKSKESILFNDPDDRIACILCIDHTKNILYYSDFFFFSRFGISKILSR